MKQQRFDTVSLVFGVVFLAVASAWALGRLVRLELPSAGWVFASILVVAGAAGLISAVRPTHKWRAKQN